MRKTIAKTMTASLRNAAQLTHTASFDAANILEYRKLLKNTPEYSGVTLTDMVLYAVTRTLPAFPALNAWLMEGDVLRTFNDVSLACAVDTERGLMVPVINNASGKSLLELSRELKTLAEGCRNGTISPDLLTGGSFTVSNLGQYGVESFTPILNPPQTGILGVCGITQRVRITGGQLAAYPAMPLSLTYDHRALDGAPASKFLQTLCKNLETFTTLLAG
ncbi:MAG: 2-oxo acid dehydrogenase subunit E2 [Oscillospiraceae bacterium]|nr:2-oxo acid dehydrogenase subunit E2 [Oscillospiraceae bacterium]